MSIRAPAARRSAVRSAARKIPAAVARAEAIAGSITCAARPTRLTFPRSCRWHRESSSARAREAARHNTGFQPVLSCELPSLHKSCRQGCLRYDTGKMPGLRNRQCQKFINLLGAIEAHDGFLQFFALIFADHVAAERVEFHCDFLFGHRIARIALGNIDPR